MSTSSICAGKKEKLRGMLTMEPSYVCARGTKKRASHPPMESRGSSVCTLEVAAQGAVEKPPKKSGSLIRWEFNRKRMEYVPASTAMVRLFHDVDVHVTLSLKYVTPFDTLKAN